MEACFKTRLKGGNRFTYILQPCLRTGKKQLKFWFARVSINCQLSTLGCFVIVARSKILRDRRDRWHLRLGFTRA